MSRQFSSEQERYIIAKAAIEAAREELARRKPAISRREMSDEELTAHVEAEMAIEDEIGYPLIRDEFFAAEAALIEWGKQIVISTAKETSTAQSEIDEIESMCDNSRFMPSIRRKLVELIMRLAI